MSCTGLRLKENISNLCRAENESSLVVGLCELDREVQDSKIKLQTSEYDKGSYYVRTHKRHENFVGKNYFRDISSYITSNILYP